ncbi:helix-turn-helix domain-containing protein [Hymenobacter psoromatis]|uniref:helix-turn-helix domain-containing protein n=1 Tax=Hymenobacter psoromatis TaxID=1484116 RepID=UPI001CBD43A6|nr:AraC family transcriptional regulator [Hymenobacter psoromatis]
MPLPLKVLSRKDEITADFTRLVAQHFDDVLHDRTDTMLHTKEFADRLFIHPTHLSNTIKLTLGTSPCDFIEARLLAEAQRFLCETALSVAEIGEKLTYSEPTNFVKFFKRLSGTTPLRYRRAWLAQAAQ